MTENVAGDYWKTQNGILERFRMLADDVQLATFNDAVKSALVVEPGPMNFVLGVGQEISVYNWQDKDMNTLGKVWEVAAPFIKRPTSIPNLSRIPFWVFQ